MENQHRYRIVRVTYATGRKHFFSELNTTISGWTRLHDRGYETQAEAADAIQQHKNIFIFKQDVVWEE